MVLTQLIHLTQAALAVHGATHSYTAITNLQRYEEPTEKLAKHSDEAARQLRETRVTQAVGALALAASLLTSLYLTLRGGALGFVLRTAVGLVVVGVLASARARVASFWAPRDGDTVGGRVPLPKMGSYNEAQRRTQGVLRTLDWLAYSWAVVLVVGLF